jgi:hypothetical protein
MAKIEAHQTFYLGRRMLGSVTAASEEDVYSEGYSPS